MSTGRVGGIRGIVLNGAREVCAAANAALVDHRMRRLAHWVRSRSRSLLRNSLIENSLRLGRTPLGIGALLSYIAWHVPRLIDDICFRDGAFALHIV